jgi:dTDP-glucose 4,6-dehydratase
VQELLQANVPILQPLSKSTIVMTGGTGVLGAWIIEMINALNLEHGLDIALTVVSRNPEKFHSQYSHFQKMHKILYLKGDIRYLSELSFETTHLIHAAALTDRNQFSTNPTLVGEINAQGTIRVLRSSQLLPNIQRILVMSSGLIYGTNPRTERISEAYAGANDPFDFQSIYSESKRFSEAMAAAFMAEAKLPIVVLRPFAFVGPYQNLALPWAVTDFIRDAINGGPIKIMGDGSTVRSIMYSADFALWTLAALANAKPRSVYNIGSPESIDLFSLAKLITQFFSPIPEIQTNVGQVELAPSRLVPSVDKAMKELGVRMSTDLFHAIQKTISWHKYRASE